MNAKKRILIATLLALVLTPAWAEEDHDHEHTDETAAEQAQQRERHGGEDHGNEDHGDEDHEEGHGHEEGEGHEEGVIRMNEAERAEQGIEVGRAERRPLEGTVLAPAEVVVDAYRSAKVSPRIPGQITARHARLGDKVKRGQRLVTLSSVEMARAQGDLLVADREWQRVRKLGKQVVSERRWVEAQVARQLALARVRAYGMTEVQIQALLRQGDVSRATGDFDLTAPLDGTVIRDDFVLGELAEPGRVMFEISDEDVLWVQAQLNPVDAARIPTGAHARIRVGEDRWIDGRVVQRHHRLQEATRTQILRIEVDNRDDHLHPGQFVEAVIETESSRPVVAVPKRAVVLMQGAYVVFVVEGDEIRPQPVETGVSRGGWTEIRAGLHAGEPIVARGAYYLKALLLKSQMGEGHAH